MEEIQTEETKDILTDEVGMTTAELLGNAALAIAALVGIWILLQGLGVDVVNFIKAQIGV